MRNGMCSKTLNSDNQSSMKSFRNTHIFCSVSLRLRHSIRFVIGSSFVVSWFFFEANANSNNLLPLINNTLNSTVCITLLWISQYLSDRLYNLLAHIFFIFFQFFWSLIQYNTDTDEFYNGKNNTLDRFRHDDDDIGKRRRNLFLNRLFGGICFGIIKLPGSNEMRRENKRKITKILNFEMLFFFGVFHFYTSLVVSGLEVVIVIQIANDNFHFSLFNFL